MVLSGMLLWFTLLPTGLEQPLVQAVRGVPLASRGGSSGRISSSAVPVLPRCSHFEFRTSPSPSYLSVLLYGCCLWSTSYWFFGTRALLGSTVDTLWEVLDEFHLFSTVR